MTRRVYLALAVEDLLELRTRELLPAGGQRFLAAGEEEDDEYAALLEAADASSAAQSTAGTARRVVVVAELDGDPDAEVPRRRVVAIHVDADPVDLGVDPDHLPDLGWFALQELDDLVAQLGALGGDGGV